MPVLRLSRDDLAHRAGRIRLLLLDVDGVLTDGTIILNDQGVESKHFSVRDGGGISIWRKSGRRVGILSGRTAEVVNRRAAELGIEPVIQGSTDKVADFHSLLKALSLKPAEVAFMGDDLPDLPVLTAGVGLAACPADAAAFVREHVHLVTEARGGQGAVRELIELLLHANGEWAGVLAHFKNQAHASTDSVTRSAHPQPPD